jgi:hypothetical protein
MEFPVQVFHQDQNRRGSELREGPTNFPEVSVFNRLRLSERLLILTCFCLMPRILAAQVVPDGQQLTVTTGNAVAIFQGPDLVGLTNTLTGESYLKCPPSTPLMNLETLAGPSYSLQASAWTPGAQAGGGATGASLTMQDSVRSVTIRRESGFVEPGDRDHTIRADDAAGCVRCILGHRRSRYECGPSDRSCEFRKRLGPETPAVGLHAGISVRLAGANGGV